MKTVKYRKPKSAFLSVDKDFDALVSLIMSNKRLKKMLYYTSADCLSKPDLTQEQSKSLFGKQIRIVPKIDVTGEEMIYMIISFDNFSTNGNNPEFLDNAIEIDIICNYDLWHLKDFELRPYKIAGEIDAMLQEAGLTGLGDITLINGR
jgi:hypothetical protein